MRSFLTRIWATGVVGTFLAGLLVLLPAGLTVIIVGWLIGKIAGLIGPGSFLGELLQSGGGRIVGPHHVVLAFLIGLALAMGLIWVLGLLVKSQARYQVSAGIDWLAERLPLVRSIYRPVSQVVRLLAQKNGGDLKGMQVVNCRIGGTAGVDSLALVTSPKVFMIAGQRRRMVYVPASPVPMSGFLLLVPEDCVTPMPEISVDEMMQICLSLGVVLPEGLVMKPPAIPAGLAPGRAPGGPAAAS